ELQGVAVGPKIHEERARLFLKHVAMQCRDLDAGILQRANHRIDLLRRQLLSMPSMSMLAGVDVPGVARTASCSSPSRHGWRAQALRHRRALDVHVEGPLWAKQVIVHRRDL